MPSEVCLSIQDMLTGQRLCQSSSHNDAVLAALNQQRNDGILCDITLIAEEQKFPAHKAVLAACSDYFRAMFSLCMVESCADEVNLHGITGIGLKQALDFAYTGQVLLEPGVIQDVLAAGSHLQLLEMLSLCSHYLIQDLFSTLLIIHIVLPGLNPLFKEWWSQVDKILNVQHFMKNKT